MFSSYFLDYKKLIVIIAFTLIFACSNETPYTKAAPIENPKNETIPFEYEFNGISIENPYHWLSETQSNKVQIWIQSQQKLTQEYFNNENFQDFISKQPDTPVSNYLWPSRRGYFFFFINKKFSQEQVQWQLSRYNSINQSINHITIAQPDLKAVKALKLSPYGRYAAYLIQTQLDQYRWHLYDFSGNKFLARSFPQTQAVNNFQWIGESQFIYSSDSQVKTGNLKLPQKYDSVIFSVEVEAETANSKKQPLASSNIARLNAQITEDLNYLVISTQQSRHKQNVIWVKPLNNQDKAAIKLIEKINAKFQFLTNRDEKFYFLSNLSASRNRIISIDLKSPSRRNWKEVVAQTNDLLVDAQYHKNRWLLNYKENSRNRLYVSQLNGSNKTLIETDVFADLQFSPKALMLNNAETEPSPLVSLNSLSNSSQVFHVDIESLKFNAIFDPKEHGVLKNLNLRNNEIKSQLFFFRSLDSSRIPITLLAKGKIRRDRPTLLMANNGFGNIFDNQYEPLASDFINSGGTLALVHSRGGGIYGTDWYLNGAGKNKNKAVADLIAAQSWLLDKNYSSTKKLAIYGNHINSPIIAQAINQSENAFAAAIFQNGYYNLALRAQNADPGWAKEFGYSNDRASSQRLLSLSPFEQIHPKAYPASLIITDSEKSDNLQFLAKLQNYQQVPKPVLYMNKATSDNLNFKQLYFLKQQLSF